MTEEIITKVEVDCSKPLGEQAIVLPLTAEELTQRELEIIAAAEAEAQRQAEAEALEALKVSARAKLVAGQPLTEAEAATLVL